MTAAAGPDSKPASVRALKADAEYFASELVTRLEALHRHQGSSRLWPQAAILTRRIEELRASGVDPFIEEGAA